MMHGKIVDVRYLCEFTVDADGHYITISIENKDRDNFARSFKAAFPSQLVGREVVLDNKKKEIVPLNRGRFRNVVPCKYREWW